MNADDFAPGKIQLTTRYGYSTFSAYLSVHLAVAGPYRPHGAEIPMRLAWTGRRPRSGRRRLPRDEAGSTAVEVAICLPILLIILFGVFHFGWVRHTRSSLRFSLEEASRMLVIDPNTTQAAVQTFVGDKFRTLAKGEVQVSLVKSDTANGRIASLSASFNSVFTVPLVGSYSIPHSVTVTRPIRAS